MMILSRGICSVCGASIALRKNGTIRSHQNRRTSKVTTPSGTKVFPHCHGTYQPAQPNEEESSDMQYVEIRWFIEVDDMRRFKAHADMCGYETPAKCLHAILDVIENTAPCPPSTTEMDLQTRPGKMFGYVDGRIRKSAKPTVSKQTRHPGSA